jgi:hypothetical protein
MFDLRGAFASSRLARASRQHIQIKRIFGSGGGIRTPDTRIMIPLL